MARNRSRPRRSACTQVACRIECGQMGRLELLFMYLSGTYGCGATCVQNMTHLGDRATAYSRLGVSEGRWSTSVEDTVVPLFNRGEGDTVNMADIHHVWARMHELGFIAGDMNEGFPIASADIHINDAIVIENGDSCLLTIFVTDDNAQKTFLDMVSSERTDGGATFFTIVAIITAGDGTTEQHFIGCRRIFCSSIKPPQGGVFSHIRKEEDKTKTIRNVHAWLCAGGEQAFPAHLIPEDTFCDIMFDPEHRAHFESSLSEPYEDKTVTIQSIIGPVHQLRQPEVWDMPIDEASRCLLMPDIETIEDDFTKLHAATFISGETAGKMKFTTLSE